MRVFYLLTLLGAFGMSVGHIFLGKEFFGDRKRAVLPPSVRQTPGQWRSYLGNHGFRGGK